MVAEIDYFPRCAEQTAQEEASEIALSRLQAEAIAQAPPAPVKPVPKPGALAAAHGLDIRKDNDEIVFSVKTRGSELEIARCTREPESVRKAEQLIEKLEKEKQTELEKKYGVAFSKEDEAVETQIKELDKCGNFIKSDRVIKARKPMMPELLGIGEALRSGEPSHLARDNKQGVKFYFLKENFLATDGADTLANFMQKDKDGRPAVYFWPQGTVGRLTTEEDHQKWGVANEKTIESLTEHELAHNSQFRLKWDDSPTLEKIVDRMGWHVHQVGNTCEYIWMIRGKKDDYYRISEDGYSWLGCNKQGEYINGDGAVVAKQELAAQYTSDDIRARALVKPPTEYFDNAVEMAADALMMFRASEGRRAELLRNSRDFYSFIREQDQMDIDHTHGKDNQGKSKKIRLPDGVLVDNTAQNAALVSQFEAKAGGAK